MTYESFQKRTAVATMIRQMTSIPPTTPPTIAPVLLLFELPPVVEKELRVDSSSWDEKFRREVCTHTRTHTRTHIHTHAHTHPHQPTSPPHTSTHACTRTCTHNIWDDNSCPHFRWSLRGITVCNSNQPVCGAATGAQLGTFPLHVLVLKHVS